MRPLAVLPLALCSLALLASGAAQATKADNDAAMVKLATDRGCMDCHSVQPTAPRADGLPPIAPAWRDVSLKYRNDPLAYEKLTRTVLDGSNPARRHWAGQVGAQGMPPNAGEISPADAQMLVNWILVLVP
jgi:cytochrome c